MTIETVLRRAIWIMCVALWGFAAVAFAFAVHDLVEIWSKL